MVCQSGIWHHLIKNHNMSLQYTRQMKHYRTSFFEDLSLAKYLSPAKFSSDVNVQTSAGHFSGCTAQLQTRYGYFSRGVASQAVYYQGLLKSDAHIAMGYVEKNSHLFLNGQKISGGSGFILKPDAENGFLIPANTPISLSLINTSLFSPEVQNQYRNLHGNFDDFIMLNQSESLITSLFHSGQLSSITDAQSVSNALNEAMRSSRPLEVRANNRGSLFSRAVRLMASKPFAIKKVSDLASEVCTSQRSLEKAFNTTGMSPREFLRICQLNRFRDAVHEMHPNGDNLATIANKIGVSNYSRLSKDYKSFFGELPTQTRRTALL